MSTTTAVGYKAVEFSLGYKLVWGLAALGSSMIAGIYGALLPIFYQDYLGLAARWIAIASAIYAIWNAINDPLFGYITDRTRFKGGRRIPYMRYTAPFLALTFIMVWFVSPQAGDQSLFIWMLVSTLLFDTCYTIIGLCYSAMLPEVTESDAQRNHLQISASLFGLIGVLLGFIIPDIFRPKAGGSPSFLPLQIAMIVVAVVCALLIITYTLVVRERPEFTRVDKPLNFIEMLKYTFTSKSFLILVSENFMVILMQAMLLGSIFYVADYVLQINTVIVLITIFIPLAIGVPLTNLIRARIGVVGAQQVLLVISGVGLMSSALVPESWMLLCIALAGFGLAGPQTLTNVLFGQVADEDELRSGVRREGAFFGINALITKPAQSIALTLTPFILEFTNFVTREQNQGQIFLDQPGSAIMGIKTVMGLIPGAVLLLGAVILIWFPLRGDYLQQIKTDLLALHQKKHEELIALGKE
jgi:GPH family glycoside/pentoside/hexuronide:cation symporter